MNYKVIEKNNYKLHLINTDRFKTIKFRVILKQPVIKEEIVLRNMLLDVLTYSCMKYPSKKELVKQAQNLYGASVYSRGYRIGKMQLINIYLTVLNEKYTESGMLEESLKLLSEILFNPKIEDDRFDEESFNLSYRQNLQSIKNLKDSKGKYATIRMLENMSDNKEYTYNEYGYIDDLNKQNSSVLYDYYKKIINTSKVDIYVIGNIENIDIEGLLDKYMKFENNPNEEENAIIKHEDFRNEINIVKEQDNNNQSNLVIGCKLNDLTNFEMNYVLTIYNIIFGSGADSKLFKNVREENSLCYYVTSSVNKLDNLLFIRSGISKNNFDKVVELINKNMELMTLGEFTDDDIAKAKNAYLSFVDEIKDNDDAIIETYIAHDILGIDLIDERKEQVMKVTKEDIINVSKKIKIDTIYLLEGDKNEGE